MFVTASPSLSVISLKLAFLVSKASVTPSWVKGWTRLVWKLAVKLRRKKEERVQPIQDQPWQGELGESVSCSSNQLLWS